METYIPAKLAYKVFEPSRGADNRLSPIIFLHGLSVAKENWGNIPQKIADETKRRGYVFDARNHGDSEYCKVFNFKVIIDDLFHFMDTIQAPKAAIIGHSMGGVTAIQAALRKPERIDLLIVEDMYTKKFSQEFTDCALKCINLRTAVIQRIPGSLNELEALKFYLDTILSHVSENDVPFIKTADFYNADINIARRADGGFELKYDQKSIEKALKDVMSLMDEPSGQYYGPTHFLYGNRSPYLVGNEKEDIKKYFPNAEFVEFENASHFLHMEYPKEFSDQVLHIFGKLKDDYI